MINGYQNIVMKSFALLFQDHGYTGGVVISENEYECKIKTFRNTLSETKF